MKHFIGIIGLMILLFGAMVSQAQNVDDLVFGIFCGKCSSHCATFYSYSKSDSTTLYVDSTDSYFQRHDSPIVCLTPVHDQKKIALVRQLITDIPDELLFRTELSRTFGCPDCSDACGIYMEFNNHDMRYRFYIDTQTAQLKGNVKYFAERVKDVVKQLKKQ